MASKLTFDREAIADFCRRWNITELSLFGSVLRDDFRPDSDVDVLVTFVPGEAPSLFKHVDMVDELEAIFRRKVDLLSRNAVEKSENWIRRRAILDGAERIYTA